MATKKSLMEQLEMLVKDDERYQEIIIRLGKENEKLQQQIDKALEYLKDMDGFVLDDYVLWEILKGRDNITISREQRLMNRIDKAIKYMEHYIEVEDAPLNERIKIEFEYVIDILRGKDE